jgi:SurA-like protein/parvulin-like peptidyl-prolyl cis-trans isomerase-like protein
MLFAVALLAGCGGGGSAAKLDSSDIAVVGPVHVTQTQYQMGLDAVKRSYASAKKTFPKAGTTDFQTIKGQLVEQLVVDAEREAKAKSMGIVITPAKVQARLDQIKKQYFSNSETKYKAQLKKVGLSDAEVREDIRQQLISEDVYSALTSKLTVPQSDIDAYYKSHASQYAQPASRDVRYILVGKSKATAQSVYNQLKSGNTKTWCTLAKKYAKDASGQNCGKATFTKGETVAVFDKAAFSSPTNKVVAPFYDPTNYKAWFVIEPISAVKKAAKTPEKSVSATIKQTLLTQKQQQTASDWAAKANKQYCKGSQIKYAVGYQASPDPCTVTTTTNSTTTG